MCCLCHRPISVCIHMDQCELTQTLLTPRGRVWGLIFTEKFFESWNAAISVDERKNAASANQHLSSTDGRSF